MLTTIVPKYGPPEVVNLCTASLPRAGTGEVLVRVKATSVTSADARMRAGRFPMGFATIGKLAIGIRGPRGRTLGGCVSGTVEEVGPGVTNLHVGDEVVGMTGMKMGAHAQYTVAKEKFFTAKPQTVPHTDAAAMLSAVQQPFISCNDERTFNLATPSW